MRENIKLVLREYVSEKELVEEGFKEWALAGLMTLASLSGIAQKKGDVSSEDIKKAEMVQQRLENGDKDLLKLFSKADIELNRKNLETLKGFDLTSKPSKVSSVKGVENRLKQGYVLSKAEVSQDTIWQVKPGEKVFIDTLVAMKYGGDMFKTGSFDMRGEVINEIQKTINTIKEKGGTINKVYIESSTDKEPIKMGNEKLAQLRAQSIVDVLKELGVEVKMVIKTIPEQGPDVYTNTMSPSEREETRKQTAEFRYNKIVFDVTFEKEAQQDTRSIKDFVPKLRFEVIKGIEGSHGSHSAQGGKGGSLLEKVKLMCKKIFKKSGGKAVSCPRF